MSADSVLGLIPAWNEAAFIGPVVTEASERIPVLVVDDGSTDETPLIAEESGATVVNHAENRGKGEALLTGFSWAKEHHYQAVLTLDADGQHDPAEIPKFLQAYESGSFDLIIGRRQFNQMPFPNRFANPIGSRLLSLALRQRIYDNQSGYRLHTRKLLDALNLTTTGFELEVEVIIQAVCMGMRIGWIPIRTIYGTGKVSYFHPIHDSRRFLGMVWHAYRYRNNYGTS